MYFERSMTRTTPWNTSVVHHFFWCVAVSGECQVSPVAFFLNILWFEGLLWVAWPSEDEVPCRKTMKDLLFRKDLWESTDSSDPHHGIWLKRGLDFRVLKGFGRSIEWILINPTSTKGCDVFEHCSPDANLLYSQRCVVYERIMPIAAIAQPRSTAWTQAWQATLPRLFRSVIFLDVFEAFTVSYGLMHRIWKVLMEELLHNTWDCAGGKHWHIT